MSYREVVRRTMAQGENNITIGEERQISRNPVRRSLPCVYIRDVNTFGRKRVGVVETDRCGKPHENVGEEVADDSDRQLLLTKVLT
ncbi:MAG: hypothetical protein ACLSG8_09485 [Barnesiella sp.]